MYVGRGPASAATYAYTAARPAGLAQSAFLAVAATRGLL